MKEAKATKFSQSIVFKCLILLISFTSLTAAICLFFFIKAQVNTILSSTNNNNKAQLHQLAISTNNEIRLFANRIIFLARTSAIQNVDSETVDYLNNESFESLFSDDEFVQVYNNENQLFAEKKSTYFKTNKTKKVFPEITAQLSYMSPWIIQAEASYPYRIFSSSIQKNNKQIGNIVASFGFQRIERYFSDFQIGTKGFLIAIAEDGKILYLPPSLKSIKNVDNISNLGFEISSPKTFKIQEPTYITLFNGNTYLANYEYSQAFNFGLISLQPKKEIDAIATPIKNFSLLFFFSTLIVISLISLWLFIKLGGSLNKLIQHIKKITEEDLDVDEISIENSENEIGQISKAFNIMHSTIKNQIKELKSHRKLLEQEVLERTQELEMANKKLSQMSRTDELTGLPNRRDIHANIENEISRVSRTRKPFCFIFIDIDHFKSINDTYGHSCGDAVLKTVAQIIRGLLRNYDIVARYGGEEFLVLLPETDLDGASVVAGRFREQIESTPIRYNDYIISVTITLGVSQYDGKLGADGSIQLADKALYKGKESGRNKVVVWRPEQTSDDEHKIAAIEKATQKNQKI